MEEGVKFGLRYLMREGGGYRSPVVYENGFPSRRSAIDSIGEERRCVTTMIASQKRRDVVTAVLPMEFFHSLEKDLNLPETWQCAGLALIVKISHKFTVMGSDKGKKNGRQIPDIERRNNYIKPLIPPCGYGCYDRHPLEPRLPDLRTTEINCTRPSLI